MSTASPSITPICIELLAAKPAGSVDRYVLLDAQDWMTDDQLNALWTEITRTAARRRPRHLPHRRRTEPAARPRLAGAARPVALRRTRHRATISARDRSAIYGGFHLYVKQTRHEHDRAAGRPCRADGRRLPLPAPYLRPDPQILSARPRPADSTGSTCRPAARVLEVGCGTGRNLVLAARALSRRALLRPRHFGRDAGDGRGGDRAAKACPAASRWRAATPPISTPSAVRRRAASTASSSPMRCR